jgi:hypothetical protein
MSDTKSNAEMKRHPLAIAWDEWLASPEGQGCCNFASLSEERFLENRLNCAFNAGASTAQAELARQVIAEINDGISRDRLRDLFTRLNVNIEE